MEEPSLGITLEVQAPGLSRQGRFSTLATLPIPTFDSVISLTIPHGFASCFIAQFFHEG